MAIYNKAITATSEGSSDKIDSGSGNRAITTIIVCNTTASDKTLTLYAVPNGKSAFVNPECTIVSALTLPPGETVSFDQEKLVLGNNDVLCGIASIAYTGTGVSVVVSTLPV